jgi:hypothetical protein
MKKLKNLIRFQVSLFKNDEGTIWEQEFTKPILNYREYVTVTDDGLLRDEVHPYPVSPYDLFDDEVIKTIRNYSIESGLALQECINLFQTSGNGNVYIDLGNDEEDVSYSTDFFENSRHYPYYKRDGEEWVEVFKSLGERFDDCKSRLKQEVS